MLKDRGKSVDLSGSEWTIRGYPEDIDEKRDKTAVILEKKLFIDGFWFMKGRKDFYRVFKNNTTMGLSEIYF